MIYSVLIPWVTLREVAVEVEIVSPPKPLAPNYADLDPAVA